MKTEKVPTVRRRRKSTRRLVAQLEHELADSKVILESRVKNLHQTIVSMGTDRDQKNEAYLQALNERDEARNQRDLSSRQAHDDRVASSLSNLKVVEISKDLWRLQDAHAQLNSDYVRLLELNDVNFDRALRNADVAAMLVSCLVEVTGEDPTGTMMRVVNASKQIGIDLEKVRNEVQSALMRGNAARVEQAVDVAVKAAVYTESSDLEVDLGLYLTGLI